MMDGRLTTLDDRPALVFERPLAYPIERVWRAISEPAELERWFLGRPEWKPERGETFEVLGEAGEITECDPPRVLEWTWGGERFRFELREEGGDCVLTFTHVFDDRAFGAQHAAGWETYFARLDAHLAGGFLSEDEAHEPVAEYHERYCELYGLDPEVGRRTIAVIQESGVDAAKEQAAGGRAS